MKDIIYVLIETNDELDKAKKILESYGEKINSKSFDIEYSKICNMLYISQGEWIIGWTNFRSQVSLDKLETTLKEYDRN